MSTAFFLPFNLKNQTQMKKVLLVAIAFVGMNSFSYSSSVGAIQNADYAGLRSYLRGVGGEARLVLL